jgi:FAD/FMN-containing dehydrogenase
MPPDERGSVGPDRRIGRRSFLGLAGGAIAGGALAACGPSTKTAGPPKTNPGSTSFTTKPTTPGSTTTSTTEPATAADWSALSNSLSGPLVRPGNSAYAVCSELFNPVFDSVGPQGIAYCASPKDVQTCLSFVQHHGIPVAARSGGHSYAGYSSSKGLIIDVTRQASVDLDAAASTATVGAGARLVDIYGTLGPMGFALPGGSCPTVGISGLTMGGGLGVVDRQFGLTCDNLLGATVVLANGDVVECSASDEPDLFWALRGGGGGNFGVVTEFTFKVHPIGDLGLFTLVWPWSDASAVIGAWQHWAPTGPDAIWSNCQLLNSQSTPSGIAPAARVTGVYVGSLSSLNQLVSDLVSAVGASPFDHFTGADTYPNTMMIEAGCEGDSVAQCHLPSQNPAGILTRSPFAAKSDWFSTALPPAGIDALVGAIDDRQTSGLAGGGIVLDSSGGAINQVAADATAFVHRDALASIQYSVYWGSGTPQSTIDANLAWLEQAWTSMRPYVNGQAYQNYIDPDLAGWEQAYYGTNLPRLQQVKSAYDPHDLFRFAQSIPL